MNPNVKFATMFILALATIGTTATAFAQTEEEEEAELGGEGIEIADEAVHERFPPEEGEAASEEDIRFHQALCEAGITTQALEELGGCEILPPLVPEIDEVIQDEEEE
ncbi:MAG TPA: hypothetical protein VJ643_00830 [Nitrososphaera sp.]|nr:hypothetical protein [Nitrososphaera sp.]